MKNLTQYVLDTKKISSIDDYIQEGLRINKSTKENIKLKEYKYFPEDREELKKIIQERLDKDKNADLNDIDVSKITDMSYLFNREFPHNIDISDWDVSNVENMESMFFWCDDFNCDLSNWDVSKVKKMNNMFDGCVEFEGKGLENWVTDSLKNTYRMFYDCHKFNCDLSNWNMSNAEHINCMFCGCKKFEGKGLDKWKLNSLKKTVRDMFFGCESLYKKPSWYEKYF